MSFGEKELLNKLDFFSNEIAENSNLYLGMLDYMAKKMNAVIHLNATKDLAPIYISSNYLERHNRPLEFIQNHGAEFLKEVVDKFTFEYSFPIIYDYLEKGDFEKNLTVFQKYKISENGESQQHFSTIRFNQDANQFFCIDFNVYKLDFGAYIIKEMVDLDKDKEKLYPKFKSLTKSEKVILKEIALGKTNRQIGELLFLSEHTVRTHRNNIYRKTGITNLKTAIDFAILFKLI